MPRRSLHALCAIPLLLPFGLGPLAQEPVERATPAAAKAAIDAGDFERALALVSELLVAQRVERSLAELEAGRPESAWRGLQAALAVAPKDPAALALRSRLAGELLARWVEEARARLAAGEPRDAMLPLDDAVAIAPEDPLVHFLRGECLLRMGIADGNRFAFDDARRHFLEAARGDALPEAWSGAARALYQLYFASGQRADFDRALELARRGAQEIPEQSELAKLLGAPPRRTLAEIAFYAYTLSKSAGEEAPAVAERFEESREAYEALIGRAPEDPWAWRGLANLFLWEGRSEEARELLLRALEIAPAEPGLHEMLAQVARSRGGSQEAAALYASWVEAHPELSLGHWWLAVETLEAALQRLAAGDHEIEEELERARASFVRCRELAPEHDEVCRGYQAICRNGIGWSRYHRQDLEGARAAFLAMEEELAGGLTWQYPGRLPSGLESLRLVVAAYMQRANDEEAPLSTRNRALERAAEIGVALHRYDPENADLANDCGFLNRDAGVALQQEAETVLLRAEKLAEGSAEEAALARAEAEALLRRARAAMEESYGAYLRAAELSPQDARVQNDTGLILTYYLQRDLERAEHYLRLAIELGNARLAAGISDPEQLAAVTEAVGDAHQNLGVLLLTLRADAAGAREWFQRSLASGSTPRPQVELFYLPLCEKVIAGEVDVGTVQRSTYWADLAPERVLERIRADQELRRVLFREDD